GVPAAGVGVSPAGTSSGVEVVEDALHHAGIEQQALDLMALPGPACVGGPAIDPEGVSPDGYFSPALWDAGLVSSPGGGTHHQEDESALGYGSSRSQGDMAAAPEDHQEGSAAHERGRDVGD